MKLWQGYCRLISVGFFDAVEIAVNRRDDRARQVGTVTEKF
jgi:hypothetical protein